MRKVVLILVICVGGPSLWFLIRRPSHKLTLHTHFRNALGLQRGAHVRVDGVDSGSVDEVRVDPQLGDRPVEVRMVIRTPKAPSLPADATTSLDTDGVLGPTFVEIDTRKANGPAVSDNAVLKSEEIDDNRAAHALEVVGNAMIEEAKKLRETHAPNLKSPEVAS